MAGASFTKSSWRCSTDFAEGGTSERDLLDERGGPFHPGDRRGTGHRSQYGAEIPEVSGSHAAHFTSAACMCSFTECSFTPLFTGAKLFHTATFLMLSFLACRKLASWSRLSDLWAVVIGIALVGSFGFLTEYLQGATDSRTGTACDVVINFCATAVGAVMACLYLRRRFTEG